MKKLATFFIALIYLTCSAGASLHLHYCMGEYVNFSFSDTTKGTCDKCGMSESGSDRSCCNDVQITAKIADTHTPSYANCSLELPSLALRPAPYFPEPRIETNTPILLVSYHGPGDNLHPLYLQHRNLRL